MAVHPKNLSLTISLVALVSSIAGAVLSFKNFERSKETTSQSSFVTGPNVNFGCEEQNISKATYNSPKGFHIVTVNVIATDTSNAKAFSTAISRQTSSSVEAEAKFLGLDRSFSNCPGGGHGAVRIIVNIEPDKLG